MRRDRDSRPGSDGRWLDHSVSVTLYHTLAIKAYGINMTFPLYKTPVASTRAVVSSPGTFWGRPSPPLSRG